MSLGFMSWGNFQRLSPSGHYNQSSSKAGMFVTLCGIITQYCRRLREKLSGQQTVVRRQVLSCTVNLSHKLDSENLYITTRTLIKSFHVFSQMNAHFPTLSLLLFHL